MFRPFNLQFLLLLFLAVLLQLLEFLHEASIIHKLRVIATGSTFLVRHQQQKMKEGGGVKNLLLSSFFFLFSQQLALLLAFNSKNLRNDGNLAHCHRV